MNYALVNPNWNFEGSIYFGCRDPHLPLEFGYSRALLEQAGHDCVEIDAFLDRLSLDEIRQRVKAFHPDITALTTAPSYLFWRCAQPELRVPMEVASAIRDVAGTLAIVGPHGSTTPVPVARKIEADVVIRGECEEILPQLAGDWRTVPSIVYRERNEIRSSGGPHASDMSALAALRWSSETIAKHSHHHHRFDVTPSGPGAEMEASRGCPYHCTFCAKENFRDGYRKRPLPVLLDELDGLIEFGAQYVYFIDEIFLPDRALLKAVAERNIKFGVQTRIDLWNEETIDLLGTAGCVSVEAGVESITEAGREFLGKKCRASTDKLANLLKAAKRRIPFVQANLLKMPQDDDAAVTAWRNELRKSGVWANEPVPLYPYPGCPDYTRLWGVPDDEAWERAHDYYLKEFAKFSDVQDNQPAPLVQLETGEHVC